MDRVATELRLGGLAPGATAHLEASSPINCVIIAYIRSLRAGEANSGSGKTPPQHSLCPTNFFIINTSHTFLPTFDDPLPLANHRLGPTTALSHLQNPRCLTNETNSLYPGTLHFNLQLLQAIEMLMWKSILLRVWEGNYRPWIIDHPAICVP